MRSVQRGSAARTGSADSTSVRLCHRATSSVPASTNIASAASMLRCQPSKPATVKSRSSADWSGINSTCRASGPSVTYQCVPATTEIVPSASVSRSCTTSGGAGATSGSGTTRSRKVSEPTAAIAAARVKAATAANRASRRGVTRQSPPSAANPAAAEANARAATCRRPSSV